MSGKRVEGYWDCDHCGTKGIGGLTKTCPKCGHPQAKGLKFYVKKGSKNYLEPEVAKNYGKGADWVCAFCGSYNRYYDVTCRNCGAGKADSEEDYFGKDVVVTPKEDYTSEHYMSSKDDEEWVYNMTEASDNASSSKKNALEEEQLSSPCEKSSDDYKKSYSSTDNYHDNISFFNQIGNLISSKNFKSILTVGGVIVLIACIVMLLVTIFTPRNYDAVISDKSWSKSITIQELRTFNESDWDVPYGARVYDEREEIRGYDHVVDHYDTEEYVESHREIDYYDVEYHDNGDGTFDEEKVPVYKTVYETKERKVPVYVDIPIYDTKYYYKIDRWCYERTAESSGKANEPYWPEFTLGLKEREGSRSESYTIYLKTEEKTYSSSISYEEWKGYKVGTKVQITVVAGIVTEIIIDE